MSESAREKQYTGHEIRDVYERKIATTIRGKKSRARGNGANERDIDWVYSKDSNGRMWIFFPVVGFFLLFCVYSLVFFALFFLTFFCK